MGCIYGVHGIGDDAGMCSLWESDGGVEMPGADENGICCVSDDPDPSYTCDSYESDWMCYDCGQDLNVADCGCESDWDEE